MIRRSIDPPFSDLISASVASIVIRRNRTVIMNNFAVGRNNSAYDFEFPREMKDALSIAPSSSGGGGGSVYSSGSRLQSSQSQTRSSARAFTPQPRNAVGGSDNVSIALSTSLATTLANQQYSTGTCVQDSIDDAMFNPDSHNDTVGRSTSHPTSIKQSPLVVARNMEMEINQRIAQTVTLRKEGKLDEALESAKQGTEIEQMLRRHQKSNSLSSGAELMHSSWFNLATAYASSSMPDEALKTYTTLLTMQRGNPLNGHIRINMGNIYFGQKQYASAIKMYKMALDQMQKDDKSMARKIRRNIGNAHFCLGQVRDAVKNFEEAMDTADDFQTGFNLLICHLALGDMTSVKKHFVQLVSASFDGRTLASDESEYGHSDQSANRVKRASHFLLTAARLIAPVMDGDDWAAGYDWVCSALDDRHKELAAHIKLEQATQKLHRKEFDSTLKSLKSLQKKDSQVKSATSTNLSFVSFLEGNIEQASEYADASLALDRYNAKALVNKANCLFINGDFDAAKNLYLEAIGVQADCSQAIFNLGLTNAQLGLAEEAIMAFDKVHLLTPNDPQVLFQIADIYELQGRSEDAVKWFNVLAARVPSDPAILARLGQLHTGTGDESQGLHYQLESFRHYPTDLDRIRWIGTWFVDHGMHER